MSNTKLTLTKTHDFCAGEKPKLTVVMIHGIAATSRSFTEALEYLEKTPSLKDIRFITYDLLGGGASLTDDKKLNYGYDDQLEALHNSIEELELTTPLILVGHSMGTFIVTRYAATYERTVKQLILISPPVYTETDLAAPAFKQAMELFKQSIASHHSGKILEEKSFINELKYIVQDKENYQYLVGLKTPATLIYGELDPIIAAYNIPAVLMENPKYLTAIKTLGDHSISQDKYTKLVPILEKALND